MRQLLRSLGGTFSIIVVTCPLVAFAQEAPSSPSSSASPAPQPARETASPIPPEELAARERIDELRRRLKEEQVRGQLERTLRENEAARRGELPLSSAALEKKKVLLPDFFGLSYVSTVGGLMGVAGPVVVHHTSHEYQTWSTYALRPSLDLVLGRRFTVGGALSATRAIVRNRQPQHDEESFSLGAAPRVGLLVPLGDRVTFWPQLGLSIQREREERSSTTFYTELSVFARPAIAFPLTKHLFASFTPSVAYGVTLRDDSDATTESLDVGTDGRIGLMF